MKYSHFCRVLAVLCWAGASTTLLAQSGDSDLKPHEPILGHAPDNGTIVVTYKDKGDTGSSKPGAPSGAVGERIASVKLEKRGTVYRQLTTYNSGAVKENWSVNGDQVCKNAHSDEFIHLTSGNPLYVDFSRADFDELSWIGMDNFKGVSGGQDKKVFKFEAKNSERRPTAAEKDEYATVASIAQTSADSKGGTAEQRKAEIKKECDKYVKQKFGDTISRVNLDVLSQLPIEYDDGEIVRAYTYSDKSEMPSTPMKVMQEIQYWKKIAKLRTVRASPP